MAAQVRLPPPATEVTGGGRANTPVDAVVETDEPTPPTRGTAVTAAGEGASLLKQGKP